MYACFVNRCANDAFVMHTSFLFLGFITEVHHVNGKGENKGVVYCEMQVRTSKKAALCISLIFYPFETNLLFSFHFPPRHRCTFILSTIVITVFNFREEKIVREVLSTVLL